MKYKKNRHDQRLDDNREQISIKQLILNRRRKQSMLNKGVIFAILLSLVISQKILATENSSNLTPSIIRLGKILCNDSRIPKENLTSCTLSSKLKSKTESDKIIALIKSDPIYLKSFQEEFQGNITLDNITHAMAKYTDSLISPSRMDDYLKGNTTALTAEEIHGYKLFNSYGCSACHDGSNFGGRQFKKLGAAKNYMMGHYTLLTPKDLGLYEVTKNANDQFVFKVPALKNVAIMAPYYHDGSVKTLHDAVYRMGKYQLGIEIPEKDINAIVVFLNSLTSKDLIKFLQQPVANTASDHHENQKK